MITHIIFDNNGVLTTSDSERTDSKVSEFLGVSIKEVRVLFEEYIPDLDKGKMTQDEFYSLALKKGGFGFSVGELSKVHLGGYILKPDVRALAIELGKNYEISLLSNFGDAFWGLYGRWGLDKIFPKDKVFVSSDIGMAKPAEEIYLYVLDKLKVKPENTIFVDDNVENVASAKKVGINALLYKDIGSFVEDLRRLGVGAN